MKKNIYLIIVVGLFFIGCDEENIYADLLNKLASLQQEKIESINRNEKILARILEKQDQSQLSLFSAINDSENQQLKRIKSFLEKNDLAIELPQEKINLPSTDNSADLLISMTNDKYDRIKKIYSPIIKLAKSLKQKEFLDTIILLNDVESSQIKLLEYSREKLYEVACGCQKYFICDDCGFITADIHTIKCPKCPISQ